MLSPASNSYDRSGDTTLCRPHERLTISLPGCVLKSKTIPTIRDICIPSMGTDTSLRKLVRTVRWRGHASLFDPSNAIGEGRPTPDEASLEIIIPTQPKRF